MSQTNVTSGSALAIKLYSARLFSNTLRNSREMAMLSGPMSDIDSLNKMKGQTSPGMPFVRIDDLKKTKGDTISVDLFDTVGGKPLMGDVNREGKGEKLVSSSMDIKIDLASKVVDGGGEMTQQRTKHELREIALSQLAGYMPRLDAQTSLVHAAGARGSQTGNDWVVPLQTDADFNAIVVNAVKAPSYNRHYVVNGANLTKGGQQLGSITSTDAFKLAHVDQLRNIIDDLEFTLQSVKLTGDPAADDSQMWVFLASPNMYSQLLTEGSLRAFQQNAVNRGAYMDKRHPLFAGEVGLWNGILVKKTSRAIRFAISESTNIITSANSATATETTQAVNAGLTAGYAVERGILLGAQALGCAYGKTKSSGAQYGWKEHWYNFESNLEVLGEVMGGKAKIRFGIDDGTGVKVPTDFGIIVVDAAVKLPA